MSTKMKWGPCTGFRYGNNKTPALFSTVFVFYHGQQSIKTTTHRAQPNAAPGVLSLSPKLLLKWLMCTCMHAKSFQLCLTLCDPMDCSPPGSSVHGILQTKILEWVPKPSSRGSSWPRDGTCISYVSCNGRQEPTNVSHALTPIRNDSTSWAQG